jgi:hypothetical protein
MSPCAAKIWDYASPIMLLKMAIILLSSIITTAHHALQCGRPIVIATATHMVPEITRWRGRRPHIVNMGAGNGLLLSECELQAILLKYMSGM